MSAIVPPSPEPYYSDSQVTLYFGECENVLPHLSPVDHVITDPPYSEHVHGSARSSRMQSSNDRGGRYGADTRRNVDLGFEHLSPELREFCAGQFARLASRWVLVFSDVESGHLWREDLTRAGLDYVRTGAWIKRGRNGARLHTTQKPEPLMAALVDQFTDPGETILDPFAGSGTTLLVATQAGRRAVGIERSERYCEVIAKRLQNADVSLFGGVA